MNLIKDEKINKDGYFYSGYQCKDGYNTLYFDKGKLYASAYSYEIASLGDIELNEDQTKEIYLAMMKYYEGE